MAIQDSPEYLQYLIIKGAVYDLPPTDRDSVLKAAEELKAVIKQNKDAGLMALALIGAEFATGEIS